MKQLLDFVPIAIFVAAYQFSGDFYVATAALMGAVTLQLAITWLVERSLSRTLLFTFWAVMLFGGLTLLLHDRTFLFWKPTVVNWLFAAIVLGSELIGRNVMHRLLGSQLPLHARAWRHVAFIWAGGFTLAGALNLYVAYRFSEAFWVGYKLWGGITLSLLQIGVTGLYLWRAGFLRDDAMAPSRDGERAP
jgi:intracellular septation protein